MSKIINSQEAKKLLNSDKLVVIDYFATWCGPCQMFIPVFDEVSKETSATLVKVDIDNDAEFAGEQEVMGVPTIIAYKNGKELNRFSGFKPKEELLDFINKLI